MRKLTVHAEAGWAFLPNIYAVARNDASEAPRNGPIARLRVEFEQPRLLGRPSLRWRNRWSSIARSSRPTTRQHPRS